MMDFTVATRDFRRALQAVVPHTGPDKVPLLYRIRVSVDRDIVWFAATDRFTMGIAIASVIEHHGPASIGPTLGVFDMLPSDAGKILALFNPAGKEDEEAPSFLLRLDLTHASHLRVTDSSGLLDGESLWLNRIPMDEEFPDLPQRLSDWSESAVDLIDDGFGVTGQYVSRFTKAASLYNAPLLLTAHTGTKALIVRCGEEFLGALMPISQDETTAAKYKHARAVDDDDSR